MTISMKQKQTHRYRGQTCSWQRGGGGEGKDWDFGISRCKLFYIVGINNKVPLYSTGNYIQYPMINHNGKGYEKEYICITESLCCTAEINTTLYINYTLIKLQKSRMLPEVRNRGGRWKGLCGDGSVLYLDCGGGYMNLYMW